MLRLPSPQETQVIPSRDLLVELQQSAALVASRLLLGVVILHEDDACPLGELSDGIRKIDMLVIHHKPEDATPCAASEAMEGLPGGIHMEGGTLLFVEGADGPVAGASPLEREISADDLHDIAGVSDLLDTLFGDTRHGERLKANGGRLKAEK
jgi:hypothetical protein